MNLKLISHPQNILAELFMQNINNGMNLHLRISIEYRIVFV